MDLMHPPVAWAVMRGMMVSADKASRVPNPGYISFMLAGMIWYENNTRIFNESLIEGVRSVYFKRQVSRLKGMYFFRSREEAEARMGDWAPYFTADNLIELELYPRGPVTVVDANWITYAPLTSSGRIETDDRSFLDWIPRYWSGKPFNENPSWELLANGAAIVLDRNVQERCYEAVKRLFPDCTIPILMARIASQVGTRGGLISPYLIREPDDRMRLRYIWSDAEFQEDSGIRKLVKHPDAQFLARLIRENKSWRMPDFRPWTCEFTFGEQEGISEAYRFPSVLHN